jgi:enoyl-CoA hydratase
MPDELILLEKDDGVATLTINRPEKRNSVNPEALLQLGDTLMALADDGETRVVVIRGTGEKAFSSGFDIGRIGGDAPPETGPRRNPLGYGLKNVRDFPCPVIAMIYGYAVGAGLELAATCDLRVAADTARLGITPTKLGLVYNAEGLRKFIDLVGMSQTRELFYTARLVDAARAAEIGLVDHVVPAAELADYTYGLAREIAGNAPLAVRGTKTTINRLLEFSRLSPEADAELRQLQAASMQSDDLKEGQRAFMEKRKPNFSGH